ncbi:nucleotide disphospho-sugar-binding domain-containing protein [Kitasatospora sp. NPDC088134]|uniref:nucleotide disphospho-sugar-binding domain-containing protein n=1 Tax=Kitasatospora sp. NPDC088134 TaxID=3364071 RepID=UPI0038095367
MRVLMITTPVPSHLAPMLPLADALRAAGHEVLLTGQPDVAATAEDAGLEFAAVGGPYHQEDVVLSGLPDGPRPLEALGRAGAAATVEGVRALVVHARYLTPRYLETAREWRPDLVVGSQLDFSAPLVGAALGVPVVEHRWGVDPGGAVTRFRAGVFLGGLADRLGLPGLPAPDLILDPWPVGLQDPEAEAATPIRYLPAPAAGSAAPAPAAGVRRIAVAFDGQNLDLRTGPLLHAVLVALAAAPGLEPVLALTPDALHRFGELPAGVRAVGPVREAGALAGCAAAVHLGDGASTLAAAAAGLPQLVLPQFMHQFEAADRVVAAGAGLSLDTAAEQDDPDRVVRALTGLLDEAVYAKAADELRRTVLEQPEPAQVVAELERLVSGG